MCVCLCVCVWVGWCVCMSRIYSQKNSGLSLSAIQHKNRNYLEVHQNNGFTNYDLSVAIKTTALETQEVL